MKLMSAVRKLLLGVVLLLACALALMFWVSPQSTKPFLLADGSLQENSIAEIRTVDINGVKQRLVIRGEDRSNPILLHVHGGPGGADQPSMRVDGRNLEDIFTVVYWDQRGAGASYSSSTTVSSLTLANIVADGLFLSEQLAKEFQQQKIYLQGHSWGTLVGIHMLGESPELFKAYFGIGQIADSRRAELLSFNFALEAATTAGDSQTVDQLKLLGAPPYAEDSRWINSVLKERALMRPYELPNGKQFMGMLDIYKTFVFYPEYSVKDKLNSLTGSEVSLPAMWMDAINANLFETHPQLEVPIYIFQGKYDQHTVTEVAKDYFNLVKAPRKEFYSFEHSAHFPHLKEFKKYRGLVEAILRRD